MNGRQQKCFVEDLLKLFDGEELWRTDLKQRFLDAKLGSDGTFNKLYREAKESGLIEECDHGRMLRPAQPKKEASHSDDMKPEEDHQTVQ